MCTGALFCMDCLTVFAYHYCMFSMAGQLLQSAMQGVFLSICSFCYLTLFLPSSQ